MLVAMMMVAGNLWADNIITVNEHQYLAVGNLVSSIDDLVTGTYVIKTNSNSGGYYLYQEQTEGDTYGYVKRNASTGGNVSAQNVFKINVTTEGENKTVTIQGYDGNYFNSTNSATSTGEESSATTFTVEQTTSGSTVSFYFKVGDNYFNAADADAYMKGSTYSGDWSKYAIYPVAAKTPATTETIVAGKVYTIFNKRGVFQANSGAIGNGSTLNASNSNQQFAFITDPDDTTKMYLYNVGQKQFFTENYNWRKATPSQIYTFETGNSDYPVALSFANNYASGQAKNLMFNGAHDFVLDAWATIDDGDMFAIIEVDGVESKLAEAREVMNSVDITWTIKYDGDKTVTYLQNAAKNSTVNCDLQYPFTTISPSVTTGKDNSCTVEATATFNTPFVASTDFENAKWYCFQNANSNLYVNYSDADQSYIPMSELAGQDYSAYKWAFIGNPIDGYKIINKLVGSDKNLYIANASNDAKPTMQTTEQVWQIVEGNTSGRFSFVKDNVYFNDYAGAHKLSFWQQGPNEDTNSNWYVSLVPAATPKGSFIRLKGSASNAYLTANAAGSTDAMQAKTEAIDAAIWYFGEDGLVSYTAGQYLGTTKALSSTSEAVTIVEHPNFVGTYGVRTGSQRYIYSKTADAAIDRGNIVDLALNNEQGYAWTLEAVTSLPVTMHQAGDGKYYATVCVPTTVQVSGATAYYVSSLSEGYNEENGGYATLTEFENGIIPANTGALLIGTTDDEVSLTVSETAGTQVTGNKLKGSFIAIQPTTTESTTDYYYFGQNNGVAGFYTVSNVPADKYISNIAWIETDATGSDSKGFAFAFGGDEPTGINSATTSDEISKNAVRYNLQGQRVDDGYKGIVIIGGKKYIVK